PGIVPIYALDQTSDGRPYYAMRFIQGQTLAEAIRAYHAVPASAASRALRFHDLLRRFVATCNAVAYAHSKGVIHRDLKPANAILGAFGETLVLDWGLAKRLGAPQAEPAPAPAAGPPSAAGPATEAGQVLGTPPYMPPEQAAGQPELLGTAADVY